MTLCTETKICSMKLDAEKSNAYGRKDWKGTIIKILQRTVFVSVQNNNCCNNSLINFWTCFSRSGNTVKMGNT